MVHLDGCVKVEAAYHFEGRRASLLDGSQAELLGQREDAKDAADTRFAEWL